MNSTISTLFKSVLICLFLSILPPMSWAMTMDELVKREGLYYEKFSDVPFTGEVDGIQQGSISKGLKGGKWTVFHRSGQLSEKGNFSDGKKSGEWSFYHENGEVSARGNFLKDERNGAWKYFGEDGSLDEKGNYLHGKRDGPWAEYYPNGNLQNWGEYLLGLKQGRWVENSLYLSALLNDKDKCTSMYSEGLYEKGVRHGYWIFKAGNKDGFTCREGNYSHGLMIGYWNFFLAKGEKDLERSGKYENDKKVSD